MVQIKRRFIVWILAALVMGAVACRQKHDVPAGVPADREQTERTEYNKEYKRGPLTLRIHLDRERMTIADRCTLTVTATLPESYEIVMPTLDAEATGFAIADFREPGPDLLDDGLIGYERVYLLEPFLSGDYTIPELICRFTQKDGEDEVHELITEAVSVTVESLLPEDLEELVLRDVSQPILPTASRTNALLWSGVGGVAAILAAGAVLVAMFKSKRRRAAVRYLPAHDVAFDALEALMREDLIGRGETDAFYVRVSSVLRHYIEDRFGIHAPEQTTEEFLHFVRSEGAITSGHRDVLDRFLTHCDMVKFAELSPSPQEIQETFDACRDFIEATRNPDSLVAETVVAGRRVQGAYGPDVRQVGAENFDADVSVAESRKMLEAESQEPAADETTAHGGG